MARTSSKTEAVREGIQAIIDENAALTKEVNQLRKVVKSQTGELDELKKRLDQIEPYMDIIEDNETKWVTISIKDPLIWRQLKIRARQLFGKDSAQMLTILTEKCLSEALFVYWPNIRKKHFPKGGNTSGGKA